MDRGEQQIDDGTIVEGTKAQNREVQKLKWTESSRRKTEFRQKDLTSKRGTDEARSEQVQDKSGQTGSGAPGAASKAAERCKSPMASSVRPEQRSQTSKKCSKSAALSWLHKADRTIQSKKNIASRGTPIREVPITNSGKGRRGH